MRGQGFFFRGKIGSRRLYAEDLNRALTGRPCDKSFLLKKNKGLGYDTITY